MANQRAKARVAELAGRQHGRVTHAQLEGLGVVGGSIARWCQTGYLHPRLPRVYAVGHPARSYESDLVEALLYAGPGAALSHVTAAHWLGLLDKRPRQIHVRTARRCRSQPGIAVHDRRPVERQLHQGFPTTTLPQLFLDLAATEPLQRVRHVLANADYRGALDIRAVNAVLGSGVPGSARLRAALRVHQPKLAYTRSRLERAFIALCEKAAIPLPQINIRIAGWLVDAVWHDCRLVVELDGHDNHSSPAQIKRDRRKEMDVRAAGFNIVRYSAEQVFEHPAAVRADVARARAGVEAA